MEPETPPATEEAIVRHAARLARLDVTEEEVRRLAPQFARILGAFEALAELTESELASGAPEEGPGVPAPAPRTRADVPGTSVDGLRLLELAPASEDGFYTVPRVLGTGGDAEGPEA